MLCNKLPPKPKALKQSICVSWFLWFGIWNLGAVWAQSLRRLQASESLYWDQRVCF